MKELQPEQEQDVTGVRGEREATVAHATSLQSRASNLLAIGLMSALGLGMLTWYYANAVTRQNRARQSARDLSTSRAQGEMPLPSLGRIDSPAPTPAIDEGRSPPPDLPSQPGGTTLSEIPLEASPSASA